mgnify:CR=1 FL=1
MIDVLDDYNIRKIDSDRNVYSYGISKINFTTSTYLTNLLT